MPAWQKVPAQRQNPQAGVLDRLRELGGAEHGVPRVYGEAAEQAPQDARVVEELPGQLLEEEVTPRAQHAADLAEGGVPVGDVVEDGELEHRVVGAVRGID